MKISSFITDGLLEVGFEEPDIYREARIFRLKRNLVGELFPFFSPHILYYEDGRAVAGVIGSMREPKNKDQRKSQHQRLNEEYAVTAYSANFPSLRSPPVAGLDHEIDLRWYRHIAEIVSEFPTTMSELNDWVRQDRDIFGVRVSEMNIF